MSRLLGIDVGSTTVKVTVIDPKTNEILYKSYERHFSKVKECVLGELKKVAALFPDGRFRAAVTGSAGLGLAEKSSISFVQEVQAAFIAIRRFYPDADAAVELGGEDAKIIFLTGGTEQRMNGSCAGGTGAFIDQMATLLNISVSEMDELALHAEKLIPLRPGAEYSQSRTFSRCSIRARQNRIFPLPSFRPWWTRLWRDWRRGDGLRERCSFSAVRCIS